MKVMSYAILLIMCILASMVITEASALQRAEIHTLFIGNISLEQLSRGEKGNGTLLYFLSQNGPTQPSLVVRFYTDLDTQMAVAEVFDAPAAMNWVPIQIQDDNVTLDPTLTPTIIIKALGGWWVRNRIVNYDLDMQVNGPVYAMWGGGYDKSLGPTGWTALVERGEPAVSIRVRDPNREGIPKWDFRHVLKSFPGSSNIYANYAERKCATSLNVDLGLSPHWPFVAEFGAYELESGQFRPPIVVDWEKGRVTHFSELVTVRNQNCSYALYLLNGVNPGQLNQPDFESPFAFYDLSGQGTGIPNLVLRTERYPAGDPWSVGLDRKVQQGRPVPTDIETVRYSWRTTVGDRLWDYKIEVLGFHPYTAETSVAGGFFSIDAPSYDQFPHWVVEKPWPVVTFIDTEGHSYASSEGIYEWSPRELGLGYIFGWEDTNMPEAFSAMYPGFRGEFRFRKQMPPNLYLSPIDNRLHLLGAEGGLWNLDNGQVLRLENLDGGNYINGWFRERLPAKSTRTETDTEKATTGKIEESLYALGGYLLYSGPTVVELRQATYEAARFEILPPVDQASWQSFREHLAPYTIEKRDPGNLKSWLTSFPGKALSIAGGNISDVRATSKGFRFVLDLDSGYRLQENDLIDMPDLEPGQYVVNYDGHFRIERQTPSVVSARLSEATFAQLKPSTIQVGLSNRGLEDLPEATLELWATSPTGTSSVVAARTIQLLAQESYATTMQWTPYTAGSWTLVLKIRQPNRLLISGDPLPVFVAPAPNTSPVHSLFVSASPGRLPVILFGLLLFASSAASLFWHEWGRPLVRQVSEEGASVTSAQDETTRPCPRCHTPEQQKKAGLNRSGSQRYRCAQCKRVYTPSPRRNGFPIETRMLAVKMYADGCSYRTIGRTLKVSPNSVARWVKRYTVNSSDVFFSQNQGWVEVDV